MKARLSTAGAVLSGLCAFKVCCILPSLLSLVGLAGSGFALIASRWMSVALLGASVLFLGRSFYSIYVLKCGSRASRWMTWASVATLAVFWTVRLATPAHSRPERPPDATTRAEPAGEAMPDSCPCRAAKKGGS